MKKTTFQLRVRALRGNSVGPFTPYVGELIVDGKPTGFIQFRSILDGPEPLTDATGAKVEGLFEEADLQSHWTYPPSKIEQLKAQYARERAGR